jgi:iron complex outermembrane receptor protein
MQALAQQAIYLPEVEILGSKPLTSALVIEWDSAMLKRYQKQTLADLLAASGGVVLNQYAPGGLSSISVRGTSAAHTAVLWNGFNLQSIMNGQYDLQLLPLHAVDKVSLREGIAGARYGSGAIGGVLHLESVPSWNTGLRGAIGHTVGSFGLHAPSATLGYSAEGVYVKATALRTTAHQRYPFQNTALPGAPNVAQNNADMERSQLTIDAGVRDQKWGLLQVWLLDMRSERGIPPPMTKPQSVARQWDDHKRAAVAYTNTYQKHTIALRTAYIEEQIRYADTTINLDQTHRAGSLLQKLEYSYAVGLWRIEVLQEGQHFSGSSPGYKPLPIQQSRFALIPGILYTNLNGSWQTRAHLRTEWVDGRMIPAIPSIQTERQLLSWCRIGAQASASYRVPTFNDLYWSPGGNANLKPEQGVGADVFTTMRTPEKMYGLHAALQLGGYMQSIRQWIVWLPGERFWSPQNEDQVTVEGVQSKLDVRYKHNRYALHGTSRVTWSRSFLSAATDPDKGKLLRYTPYFAAAQRLSITSGNFHAAIEHGYTGWRFTDRANTRWMPAVSLWHVHAGAMVPYGRYSIDLSFSVQNMLNTPYQMLAWQAMPGRVFQVSALVQIHSKPKI